MVTGINPVQGYEGRSKHLVLKMLRSSGREEQPILHDQTAREMQGEEALAAEVLIRLRERRGPGSGPSLTLPLPKTSMPPVSPTPKGTLQHSFPGPVGDVGQGGLLPVLKDTTTYFWLLLSLPPPLFQQWNDFHVPPPCVAFSFYLLPT